MENYFVITNCDGDTNVAIYTKEELLEALDDECIGCGDDLDCVTIEDIEKDGDTAMFGGQPLIIKGTIVIPEPEQTTTKYDI